ncbi:hypothetical protein ACT3CD_02930 [Geofilum sp. OHC36d9]|uniref:hypothetical protein n=1 Tax=Geofilum sp. OHC36d9 TaxID=3458413 RepID=UPI0040343A89
MGFNISGIAVAKNLQNDIEKIEKEIGFQLEFVEEINFETASSNWKEEGICDIYFGERGTIIFLNHELSIEEYSIMDLPTLTFAMSDVASTYMFHYYENGIFKRSKAESEGKEMRVEGESLDIEFTPIDMDGIIWHLIDETLGQKFMEIDLADKAFRYRLIKSADKLRKTENKENSIDLKPIGNRLKIPLLIFKYSKWIIIIGMIFTILSLTKIFDNRFGFLVIIFGVIMRRGSTWYMNKIMIRHKE